MIKKTKGIEYESRTMKIKKSYVERNDKHKENKSEIKARTGIMHIGRIE